VLTLFISRHAGLAPSFIVQVAAGLRETRWNEKNVNLAVLKIFSPLCIHSAKACVLGVERNVAFQFRGPVYSTCSLFLGNLTMTKTTLLAAAILALLTTAVQAQPVVRDGVLADEAGRTVYTFDKDEANKSNCTGGCLAAWPVLAAKPGAVAQGDFGLIDTNGAKQWTVKGKPLYYFAGDTKAGERNGDGKGGVWHVVVQSAAPGAPKQAAPIKPVSSGY
jgi:predicted lipoprotein with Yx(FWY)xxD motif